MPKVSVILPAYNCSAYLNDSISSVLSQTFKDFELIVVDDGSTDSTEKIVGRFSDARIIYKKRPHSGLSASRNFGIDISRGEYIAFIDGDDIFLPEKLARQVDAFTHFKDADIVYTSEKFFYGNDRNILMDTPYEKLSGDLVYFLKRSNFIHISTVMIKRSALMPLNFDQELKSHEDWDFFLRLARDERRFLNLPDCLTLVRIRKDSMTAEGPVMDKSRRIVGKRAREIWSEIRDGMGIGSIRGWKLLRRYASSKMKAGLMGFPKAARFNKPPR